MKNKNKSWKCCNVLPDVRRGTLLLNSFWRIKRTPTWSPIIPNSVYKVMHRVAILFTPPSHRTTSYSSKPSILDVLWGQPIKQIQDVSTSEFHEYWWNDVDFIFCPLHLVQGLRSLQHWLLQKLSMKIFDQKFRFLIKK